MVVAAKELDNTILIRNEAIDFVFYTIRNTNLMFTPISCMLNEDLLPKKDALAI